MPRLGLLSTELAVACELCLITAESLSYFDLTHWVFPTVISSATYTGNVPSSSYYCKVHKYTSAFLEPFHVLLLISISSALQFSFFASRTPVVWLWEEQWGTVYALGWL